MKRETRCLICAGRAVDRLGRPCLNCGGTGVVVTGARISRLQIQSALSLFGLSQLPATEADVKQAWIKALRASHPDTRDEGTPSVRFDAAEYAKARVTLEGAIRARAEEHL